MTTQVCQEHVHIVLNSENVSDAQLRELISVAAEFVTKDRTHVIGSKPRCGELLPTENELVEPLQRGLSPAVAFAGCHLYRRDPNVVMVYVDAKAQNAAALLRKNFASLVEEAEAPGCLASLFVNTETPAHLYAWSIYALMETYRNYCPIDFQIINEIARTWNRNPQKTAELYGKLSNQPIAEYVLSKVKPGYYTRNVQVLTSTTIAPISGEGISDQPIMGDPEDVG